MGDVVHIGPRGGEPHSVLAPPAPDALGQLCKTWGQLFDHLMYLSDNGEDGRLRQLLKEYSNATAAVPLPDVFITERGS